MRYFIKISRILNIFWYIKNYLGVWLIDSLSNANLKETVKIAFLSELLIKPMLLKISFEKRLKLTKIHDTISGDFSFKNVKSRNTLIVGNILRKFTPQFVYMNMHDLEK